LHVLPVPVRSRSERTKVSTLRSYVRTHCITTCPILSTSASRRSGRSGFAGRTPG